MTSLRKISVDTFHFQKGYQAFPTLSPPASFLLSFSGDTDVAGAPISIPNGFFFPRADGNYPWGGAAAAANIQKTVCIAGYIWQFGSDGVNGYYRVSSSIASNIVGVSGQFTPTFPAVSGPYSNQFTYYSATKFLNDNDPDYAGTSSYALQITGNPVSTSAAPGFVRKFFRDGTTPVILQGINFNFSGENGPNIYATQHYQLAGVDRFISFFRWYDGSVNHLYLADWAPTALADTPDSTITEIFFTDPADDAAFKWSGAYEQNSTVLNDLGWFFSFAYDSGGGVQVRKYIQVSPDFTIYREIVPTGLDTQTTAVLSTNTNPPAFAVDSNEQLLFIGSSTAAPENVYIPGPLNPSLIISAPKVRAWTFSLDGHDFYVLRLGTLKTLIYDQTTDTWPNWGSADSELWRANFGLNWLGAGNFAQIYGSDIVIGDDTEGLLWILDPKQGFDDPAQAGDDPVYFTRILMAQVPVRGRQYLPCNSIYLVTDNSNPAYSSAPITLETSDDAGRTWINQGSIEITEDMLDRAQITRWGSLGQMGAPGRLFRITDDGAIGTAFSLDMNDDG